MITKEPLIFQLKALFQVDATGLRSNFTKDLQAIQTAEHFINLALERLKIDSLDQLESSVKEKQANSRRKHKK